MIANCGEVAVRIARAATTRITPVFAVSAADANALHTQGRETVVLAPPAPASPTST